MASRTPLVAVIILAASIAKAEEPEIPAGHSFHGEVFNEGPRQAAYLMGGTGKVVFPVTTQVRRAQEFFEQGVGQLHGFWYFEAERSFRQAAVLDPGCAMAYWGMAMANFQNEKRAKGFIDNAIERRSSASRREQMWIDGLDEYLKADPKKNADRRRQYLRSLEAIIHEYPEEIEAKAFLAVRLWQFKKELPIPSHEAVDALLDQVFEKEPMHPAHHYLIHLWDKEKPARALKSAARCGQSAPSIAHMWHMPGHIHSRLKCYPDAVWQQEASARADHAHMMRDRVMPDQISNYAHNNEWLIRNLIHIGRVRSALDLAKNMIELPRHPKYNTLQKKERSASHGRNRLLKVLGDFELADETIHLDQTPYLEPTDLPIEQLKRLRALSWAHFQKGHHQQIEKIQQEFQRQLSKARPKAKSAIQRALAESKIHAALLDGKRKIAKENLGKAKDLSKIRLSRLHLQLGNETQAERLARKAVTSGKNEVLPLANLAFILHECGKEKEAAETFTKLRKISGYIDDLSVPAFHRLAPIAVALDLPPDWRTKPIARKDVGDRPALDSIGPFRWSPSRAPSWSLPGAKGRLVSLADFEGRPVVVIFYLGYGCLHCAQQLEKFAPKTKEFDDAGISLVAVSTDSQSDLSRSLENFAEEKAFAFPLVSDETHQVFRAYRAYDDFEDQPLHGTFLVDAAGMILWQDISYEPFTDPDFLIIEAKRLLNLPRTRVDKARRTEVSLRGGLSEIRRLRTWSGDFSILRKIPS